MHEIAKDLSILIAEDDCPITKYVQEPSLPVGCRIKHKFEISERSEDVWFYGSVIAYSDTTKLRT